MERFSTLRFLKGVSVTMREKERVETQEMKGKERWVGDLVGGGIRNDASLL